MRLVKYLFFTILALIIGIIIFMPKAELYYKAESILNKQGIVIDNEELVKSIGSLKIMHPTAYYQGVDVARASLVTFRPYLIVNSIVAEDIELLNVAKQFLDIDIAKLKAMHNIFKPYIIKLYIDGNFGVATGYVDIKKRLIHLDIVEPKKISTIRRFIKKGEKGWFYESNF